MPKVSVIMPVHNAEQYLKQCLDSVLSQTLTDIEVICVENGSTDSSLQILKEYETKDKRMSVIKQEKCCGAGHARNEGMQNAIGKYLSFLDADDYFELTMLEQLADKAEKTGADVVICDAYLYNDTSGEISQPSWILKQQFIPDIATFSCKDIPDCIFQISEGLAWNKLILRSFVMKNNLRFQVIHSANDLTFTYMAMIKAGCITILNERLIYYRRNNKSSLSGTIAAYPDGFYLATGELKKQLVQDNIYQDVKRSFCIFCLNYFVWYLESVSDWHTFMKFWNNMRDKYMEELDISGHDRSYFNSVHLYNWSKRITQMAPEEWLYDCYFTLKGKAHVTSHQLPANLIPDNSRIILYGAGEAGKSYYAQLCNSQKCRIVLWVDKKWESIGSPVSDVSEIKEEAYDYILIAAQYDNVAEEIKKDLLSIGVAEEKIICP